MEGEGEPAEIGRIKSELQATAASSEQAGSWLAAAMEASWTMAEALLAYPQLADLLGERHRIIGNNWQNARTAQLIARYLRRAVTVMEQVDFTPAALREDLAGIPGCRARNDTAAARSRSPTSRSPSRARRSGRDRGYRPAAHRTRAGPAPRPARAPRSRVSQPVMPSPTAKLAAARPWASSTRSYCIGGLATSPAWLIRPFTRLPAFTACLCSGAISVFIDLTTFVSWPPGP